MLDVTKTKEELQYALDTGWDRDAAIRHSLEVINQLEFELKRAKLDKGFKIGYDNADDWCE